MLIVKLNKEPVFIIILKSKWGHVLTNVVLKHENTYYKIFDDFSYSVYSTAVDAINRNNGLMTTCTLKQHYPSSLYNKSKHFFFK